METQNRPVAGREGEGETYINFPRYWNVLNLDLGNYYTGRYSP